MIVLRRKSKQLQESTINKETVDDINAKKIKTSARVLAALLNRQTLTLILNEGTDLKCKCTLKSNMQFPHA